MSLRIEVICLAIIRKMLCVGMTFIVPCLSGSILSLYADIQDANVVIAREYYRQCSSIWSVMFFIGSTNTYL